MRIRFSPQALAHCEAVQAWWLHNRSSAPSLFYDELLQVLELLKVAPRAGSPHPHRRRRDLRRILLRATQYHLYYTIDDQGIIILAVWSTARRRKPKLDG